MISEPNMLCFTVTLSLCIKIESLRCTPEINIITCTSRKKGSRKKGREGRKKEDLTSEQWVNFPQRTVLIFVESRIEDHKEPPYMYCSFDCMYHTKLIFWRENKIHDQAFKSFVLILNKAITLFHSFLIYEVYLI